MSVAPLHFERVTVHRLQQLRYKLKLSLTIRLHHSAMIVVTKHDLRYSTEGFQELVRDFRRIFSL
jgi:hypothetical protein